MPENVIDLLVHDHREATELVERILVTDEGGRRRELADQLIAELVRHSVVEETVVYPVIGAELEDGADAVAHDTEEHKQLERLMKQLEGLDAAAPEFLQTVQELKEVLADHVQDEEEEQFPALRQKLSDERLQTMGGAVEALKKVAPTRPHPAAPNNALFHLTVGPGVGLVDRLRDALSSRSRS